MKNISLFLTGLILIVFAGMFHIYRYGMEKTKQPPPPPPSIKLERPKAIEEKSVVAGQLTDKTPGIDDKKETPEITKESQTPQIKADTNLGQNNNPTVGTSDLSKP